jgi:hypothetical protein
MPFGTVDYSQVDRVTTALRNAAGVLARKDEIMFGREMDKAEREHASAILTNFARDVQGKSPEEAAEIGAMYTAELSKYGGPRSQAAAKNIFDYVQERTKARPKAFAPIPVSKVAPGGGPTVRSFGGVNYEERGLWDPNEGKMVPDVTIFQPTKDAGDDVQHRQQQNKLAELERKKRGLEAQIMARYRKDIQTGKLNLDKLLLGEQDVPLVPKMVPDRFGFGYVESPEKEADKDILNWLATVAELETEMALQGKPFTPAKEVAKRKRPTSLIDVDTLKKEIGQFEDSTGTGQVNETTRAFTKYQFLPSTWTALLKKHLPQQVAGMSDEQVLALGKDPGTVEAAMNKLIEENAIALRERGLPANNTTLYLSHWFGSEGTADILARPKEMRMVDWFTEKFGAENGPRYAAANGLADKTIGDVISLAEKRMKTPVDASQELTLTGENGKLKITY